MQPGQDLVDVGDRKGVVGAVVARGALGPGAPAVPGLARRIAIAHEQDVFALRTARHQHRDGLGLVETGEIEEVAVGPVGVFDVVVAHAHGRGGHDGDRIAAHLLQQRAAAPLEFLASDGRDTRVAVGAVFLRLHANGWTRHRAPAPRRARARAPRTATARPRARTRRTSANATSFSSFSSSASTPTCVISVKSRMISPASVGHLARIRAWCPNRGRREIPGTRGSAHRRARRAAPRRRAAAARSRRRCRRACAPWSCRRSAARSFAAPASSGESSGRISRSHSMRP